MTQVEAADGIYNLLHMQIRIDWDKQGYEGVLESTIKKYNATVRSRGRNPSRSSTGSSPVASTKECAGRSRMRCVRWKTSRSEI